MPRAKLTGCVVMLSVILSGCTSEPVVQQTTPIPPRVDDATRARPTDAAIRNYWILRERIAQSESIILGLQVIFAKSVLIKVIKRV